MNGKVLKIGGSVGIAIFPKHGTTTVSLFKSADEAMFACKRMGRACVKTPESMNCNTDLQHN